MARDHGPVAPDGVDSPASETWASVWQRARKVAAVLVPATLLTSLCVYIGQVYTERLYESFGVSADGLGFSTIDYVTRSLNVLVEPFPVVVAGLVALLLLPLLMTALVRLLSTVRVGAAPARDVSGPVQTAVGLAVFAVGVVLMIVFRDQGSDARTAYVRAGWWLMGLVCGLIGLYFALLAKRMDGRPGPASPRLLKNPAAATLVVCVCVLAVAFGVFQVARLYASARADRQALRNEQNCTSFAYARVFSTVDLGLEHLDVTHTSTDRGPGGFGHSYGMFRLFLQDNGYYLLWPSRRSPREGLLVLAQDDRIRVEASPQLLTPAERAAIICPRAR